MLKYFKFLTIVTSRLGVKITLMIILFLSATIVAGAAYIYHHQTDQMRLELLLKGKTLSMIGARSISRILEEAIANGVISREDVFDTYYELIPGYNPPKFHTRYDAYFDNAIGQVQDEFLSDGTVLYAAAQDINGYIPTYSAHHQKSVSGNEEKKMMGDSTKRIFNDPFSSKATKTREKGFLQTITMDTGKTVWDISSPILVFNKHWGCFKVGFDLERIERSTNRLFNLIIFGVAVFLVFSTGVIFCIVHYALKPLVTFSEIACNLADGDVDEKIQVNRTDEIGRVAESLERLRISLKAAMERLTRKRAS